MNPAKPSNSSNPQNPSDTINTANQLLPQTKAQLAKYIDHTLLKPTAIRSDIHNLCQQAIRYGFHSVCVLGRWVEPAADILHSSGVKVCGLAGFPFGADTTKIKTLDAHNAIMAGADEIDMVADLASVITGDERYLITEFNAVLAACRFVRPAVLLKVIIESAALSGEQIRFVCAIADRCGIDFLKTSTGLHPAGGASVEAVKLMTQSAPRCKIKAAGGIKSTADALAMIKAGASRLGSSASIDIIEGFNPQNQPVASTPKPPVPQP